MASRILTNQDLELFYAGQAGHPFLNIDDVINIRKDASNGIIDTTFNTPVWNRIYGAEVWAQLNMEANAFGALPKLTWNRSGWRIISDFAWNKLTNGYQDYAIAETGELPNPVYPDIQTVKIKPKVVVTDFEVSDVLEGLAEVSDDDIFGTVDNLRAFYGNEHRKAINKMLLFKAIGNDNASSVASAGYMIESIDRIVSGYSESQLNGGTAGNEVGAAVDVYGIDRHSAASWADAYVNHNNGTPRDLTDELIRDSIQDVRTNGGNTTVMITGYDTYAKLQGLYMNYLRYNPMSETQVQFGINGIQTANGIDAGVKVASLYGIPLITAVDTPKDTISRIYMLDTSDTEGYGYPRLGVQVLRPTEYYETRDFLLLNKFVVKGAYRTMGEVSARFFKAQGKIRDLQ